MRVRVGIHSIIFIKQYFCLVIFYICILVCFLPRNTFMQEDASCEPA